MSQASRFSACGDDDGANIDLGASLLLTSSKYTRIWRRSLYIGILISLKKPSTTSASHESPPSPQSSISSGPYTLLPPSPPPLASEPPARTSSAVAIEIEEVQEEGVEQRIRSDIDRIVKEKDLNSLLELGGVDRVCSVLGRQEEDTIDGRNQRVLGNTIPFHGTNFSKFLLNNCKRNSYPILMLLMSAGLSFATDFKQEGPRYGWHDGVAIIFAVILLVTFSSVANFWRERKMLKLSKSFRVQRGEKSLMVATSDIVVGDRVCLGTGNEVPADGLFVSGDSFVLEGTIKSKSDHERHPFLIAGSKVIEGHGWMLVTSVGSRTNLAERQCSRTSNPEKREILESQIEKPISYIENFALFISVLVALVVLIRLICGKDGDSNGLPEIKGNVSVGLLMEALERIFLRPQGKISILSSLVTVAILCIQHGMPLMITVSLKYQIDKVESNQEAVLNDLSACTTMGLVTVVCIDASGGLISKPMEVSRIRMGEKDISKVEGSETDLVVHDVLRQGVGLSVLAPEISISPMSNSLISWAETTWGMNIRAFRESFNILQHGKLNSDKEGSGVLVTKVGDSEKVLHLHWSGAASTILDMCSQYYDSKGECHAMENQKIEFGQVIKEMEDSGLRPIAFAYRQPVVPELEQDGLILLGLIGLKHTCQGSTKLALENLKNTGIEIKLVSEDDIMVVRAIACELGIEVPAKDGDVLEGKEFQDLDNTARLGKVDLAPVMASFCPEDKLLMVQCLQEKGHVVAFIGRLTTSYASVLEVADVGIVDNSLSTIMDRESSSISIKCFRALAPIVRAGRCKYHNIQKFIQLQLTASISGSLITLITTMSTGGSPLTAVQLIWVNTVMCLLGVLMMAMELNSEEQLANQPSGRNQSIITKKIWKNIVVQVLYQVSVSTIFQYGGQVTDSSKKVRKTMVFNTFLFCQVFNQLNTMHLLKKKVFKIVLQSYYFLGALGACFLMQLVVIEYGKDLTDCMRLNATQWAICMLVGALSWVFDLASKFIPVILGTICASESITSPFGFSSRQLSLYLYWGFPFLILFFFPVGW